MQQIAQEKTYAVYTSFAEHGSATYPTRSIICDMLNEYTGPMDIGIFFRAFLAASLTNVEICREIGTPPLGLEPECGYRKLMNKEWPEFTALVNTM